MAAFVLGYQAGAGTYNLSGNGLLSVGQNIFVGYSGTGTLNQLGGTVNAGNGYSSRDLPLATTLAR